MATPVQKVKVGIFLLISGALIVAGLFTIGHFRHGGRDHYVIIFDKTILGLYKGGMVQYMGVPVGTVDDIYVGDDGRAHVDLMIDPKKVTLREGVEASLEFYSFATGTMCIALKGGDPDKNPLPPESTIPTGSSLIDSFSNQAAELMGTFNKISEKIDAGLKGLPEGRLAEIIDEMKPFVEDARNFISDARDTLKTVQADIHSTVEDAKPGIKKFSELADHANELSKTANGTLKDLRKKIEPVDLDKVQNRLLELTQQLQDTTAKVNEMTTSVPYTVENVQRSLIDYMQNLKETMESFRQLAETLRQNPYVRGTAPAKE